ncbi:piggyBac transposable element-derived protein 3-like [Dendronephthya gigantea]|uniref:piggyBac transposable element-derived protein 3-like n=1 Tax=Dendronephthya gigantea TaxID=151771 RepID=UPI00106C5381|nr:piggyBac transposable element-derived protein 3-like [Dendronephthya gigantea]XP_028408637.1 piggyBac transposable element-derived protein 3-like [Dendronephthya gigantea]
MDRIPKTYTVRDALEMVGKDGSDIEFSDDDSEEEYNPVNNESESSDDDQNLDHSENDSDSYDDEPLAERLQKQKTSSSATDMQEKYKYRWRSRGFDQQEMPFSGDEYLLTEPEPSSLEFFRQFVTKEMLQNMCEQTNVYSVEKSGISIETSVDELEKIIGMYFLMGLVQLPSVRSYWENATRYPCVADEMGRTRFQKLLTLLHFVNNNQVTDEEKKDKLWKLRPWLDKLRTNFLTVTPSEHQSVDEMMVAFKGKYGPRVYMPKKPTKWGYKLWARASSSGFIHDFDVYQGASDEITDRDIGSSGEIVMKLASTLPEGKNHKLYADNYFTSLPLVEKLKERGIQYVGTARNNRLKGCPLKSEKSLKSQGRGAYDVKVDQQKGIIVLRWLDKKAVTLVSSYCGEHPVGTARRWNKKEKKYVDIQKPKIVAEYNKFMGGIDLMDMLCSLYRYSIKSRRWYLYIWYHTLTVAMVNSWLIYRKHQQNGKYMKLRCFQAIVAEGLLKAGKTRKRKSSLDNPSPIPRKRQTSVPVDDVRFDGVDHLPDWDNDNRQRCKLCKDSRSHAMCRKCNVYLCFNKDRNCYKEYHTRG